MAKKTILIIEDDPDTQAVYKDLLSDEYTLIQAYDAIVGAAALKKNKKIDIIVLDIMMPKKTGDEFLKEIRQNPKYKKIPVICVTVVAEIEQKIIKIDPTVTFIPKPFRIGELLAEIKKKLKE